MVTLSNSLSFLRAPLALLFLQGSPVLRLLAVFLAMATDCIDGYLARKYRSVSQFGAVLDPAMDKFFVYFALLILFQEERLAGWEVLIMLSRDAFLCLYGAILLARRQWKEVLFRSVRWGKATTALQFIVLSGLIYGFSFPWPIFAGFAIMGCLAFLELLQLHSPKPLFSGKKTL